MYKSKYKPIEGLPLTTTIPLLLEWRGMSPQKIEEKSGGKISQASIHRICKGQTKNPGKDVVEPIANLFGLDFTEIWDIELVTTLIEKGGWKKVKSEKLNTVTAGSVSEKHPTEYETISTKKTMQPKNISALLHELNIQLSTKDAAIAAELFASRVRLDLEEPQRTIASTLNLAIFYTRKLNNRTDQQLPQKKTTTLGAPTLNW